MPTVAAALRRSVAAALVMVAAMIPVTLPAVTGAAPACAAATGPHAALVIDTGTGTRSFCIALDATTVSGIHLIELAGAQDHLAYGFGSGGQAVCRLAGVGPQGDDCFADYPEYWGYWHGDGHGGWTWSSTGAASARVGGGALDAWVWGSGDSGATHRKPPTMVIDDVCVPAASPATTSSPARSTPRASVPSSGSPSSPTSTAPSQPGTTRSADPSARGVAKTSPPGGPPTAGALAAPPGPPPASAGPGPGLLVALVLGAALAGGGWLRLRSTRGRSAS
ncbi:MAG: hypothetical protein E6G58_04650 [Actinobacteria bacterium]|nr:MAG: hypothetical protein E6G58_04650 [Actinomycetota bacterium]